MRAALYARVSSEEQVEGYSIDAQRRAFRALVGDKQWSIYREYIDEGKSARSDNINKRPAFKEMISDALAGSFDVLVVHKLDRFARNLRITLEYFDRLSKAGVSFLSISENMDFSTPWGRLALTLLGGLAQFYSDNLSQETKKGWAERKEQGLYAGLLPFGIMKGDNGVPKQNPETYPGLVMAFNLAAQEKKDRQVAQALNAAGYRTAGN
jgi:site-specific DNA recombinase